MDRRVAKAIEKSEKTRADSNNMVDHDQQKLEGLCARRMAWMPRPCMRADQHGALALVQQSVQGKATRISESNKRKCRNPNVARVTFSPYDHYACILFDSGAEKSFVSSAFTHFIDIAPTTLNTSYEIELADGKVVSTNTILYSCTLVLLNHVFKIDLLPTRLGSFDVIIGMDWLAYYRALIDCYEKIVRIPLPNGEILEVQGERPGKGS
ncbi:reverse transcriptase domain-containing protein [Tanacetum coccineum]